MKRGVVLSAIVVLALAATTGFAQPDEGSAQAASELAEASCGAAGLPECPLQAWMKANAGPPMSAADTKRLERAFTRIAAFSPPGFAGWEAVAREGAAAAKKGDVEGCRAACKTCHDQHRARYRAERRAAPLP